jgi:hypothetical protein
MKSVKIKLGVGEVLDEVIEPQLLKLLQPKVDQLHLASVVEGLELQVHKPKQVFDRYVTFVVGVEQLL